MRKQLSSRVQAFRSRRANPNLPLRFDEQGDATDEDEQARRRNVVAFDKRSAALRPTRAVDMPEPPPIPRHWQESEKPATVEHGLERVSQRRSSTRPSASKRAPAEGDQPRLNFPPFPEADDGFLALPVAPFRVRLIGNAIDFGFSLAALLFFLVPLYLWASPIAFHQLLLAGVGCAYLLTVLLYGGLFLCLAGATPGMKWTHLRLVTFDGLPPGRRQLVYRFLGAIASLGAFFLGVTWAVIDEESLCWHDRISKTFLTPADP